MVRINIEGNEVDTNDINFVNVEYLNDTDMEINVHLSDGSVYKCTSSDQELVSKLDKETDLCSVK